MVLGREMSLKPRLEDVLHLVMWNGFTEDSRQAVYVSKEVYTDERVWYPFLIQQPYGTKKKTLPQIIAERCTHVEAPSTRKLLPRKGGMVVYKSEERWITRMQQIQQMAADSHQMKTFEKTLRMGDVDGNTTLVAASKNNCPKIVSYLLKRGLDYNEKDANGVTLKDHAYNSKLGRNAWSILLSESKFKAVYESNAVFLARIYELITQKYDRMNYIQNYLPHIDFNAELVVLPVVEPPKKKLKRSLYNKQFGRR
jgi:hypothetical protein